MCDVTDLLSSYIETFRHFLVTGVELELISDSNIYLMIESAICGGLSYVSQRHAKANFPEMLWTI